MISTAKAIKKTREAQGMTQKELAERCGYTVTDIKAYLHSRYFLTSSFSSSSS